ncbi:MAG: hypothetical protein L0H31_06650, partial [Nocardioidaceae bacterium]|nr:hypothetical protein [Nocardioidaceae bacterium]
MQVDVLGSELASRGLNREDERSESTDNGNEERREEDGRRHTVEDNRHECDKHGDEQNDERYATPLLPTPTFLAVLGDELAGRCHRVLPFPCVREINGRL